jgi:hypothetical protein
MGGCQPLRQALRSGEPVVAPLCYEPLTSKLDERVGFPVAAQHLALFSREDLNAACRV